MTYLREQSAPFTSVYAVFRVDVCTLPVGHNVFQIEQACGTMVVEERKVDPVLSAKVSHRGVLSRPNDF